MLRDRSSTKFCKIFPPKWLPDWYLLTLKHIECLHKNANINISVSIRLIVQQLLEKETALCTQSMTSVYCLCFGIFLLTANSSACRHLSYKMPVWFNICPFHFRRWRGTVLGQGKRESQNKLGTGQGEWGDIQTAESLLYQQVDVHFSRWSFR